MRPVFIIGCERSGTTLLGTIIGSHTECLCIPEFQVKIFPLRYIIEDIHIDQKNIINQIVEHWRFKVWGINIQSIPTYDIGFSYRKLIEWLVERYGEKIGKRKFKIWVDHTPINILYVNMLNSAFPEAKFIHIIRDGRAVAASTKQLTWGANTPTAAVKFWINRIAHGLAAETMLSEDKIIRIKYEDLVIDTVTQTKRICSFLKIDFQDNMKNADGFKVPVFTKKSHELIGKKPEGNRINQWEKVLSSREIEIFESSSTQLLSYLGYLPFFSYKAIPPSFLENLKFKLKDLLRKLENRKTFHQIKEYSEYLKRNDGSKEIYPL